jgi:drug/metabolite transporter (DMT)-like permease
MKPHMLTGIAFGVAAGAVWGVVFLAPILTPGFSAAEVSLARYLAYGAIALLLAAPRWRSLRARLTRADWIALGWLGLAGNIVYYVCLTVAVRLAGPASAAFIVGLLPVAITIIGSKEEGAVPLKTLAPSLLLAVVGVGLMASASTKSVASGWQDQAIGMACAFGSLASWTLFAVGNQRHMARLPHISSNEWSLLLGIVTGAESLLLVAPVFALASESHPAADWTQLIAVSAGTAVLASILGNALWNSASRRLPMTMTGQMVIFETLFALVYSFLWDHRWPTAIEMAAIVALIGAVSWCAAHHRGAHAAEQIGG